MILTASKKPYGHLIWCNSEANIIGKQSMNLNHNWDVMINAKYSQLVD